MRIFGSIVLSACLLLQAMPSLVELVAFTANRAELTERFCVNVEAPTLDCRAACYLSDQLADVALAQAGTPDNQTTSNSAAPLQVQYVDLNRDAGVVAAAPLPTQARELPTTVQQPWTSWTRSPDPEPPAA